MGVRHDPPGASSAANLASYAAQAEQVRRETEAHLDALRFDSLKAYGLACAVGVPAEWRAYVVRELETYVTAVQFPRGLSDWEARSFVEDRVKRLVQPYWDEIARREEHERRRSRLRDLLECGRRHFRVETFLWTRDETEEAEHEVESDLVRRVKWNWSEEMVRDLVEGVLEDMEEGDSADESGWVGDGGREDDEENRDLEGEED